MIAVMPHQKSFESAPRSRSDDAVVFESFDPKNMAWFFGRDSAGVEGYFPCGWFGISEADRSAVALRDYDGTELSLGVGDLFEEEEVYGGWILGTSDGRRGWIPLSCIQEAPPFTAPTGP